VLEANLLPFLKTAIDRLKLLHQIARGFSLSCEGRGQRAHGDVDQKLCKPFGGTLDAKTIHTKKKKNI
jgi:hypothetical protein